MRIEAQPYTSKDDGRIISKPSSLCSGTSSIEEVVSKSIAIQSEAVKLTAEEPYPLELFYTRKASFEAKIAQLQRQWEKEKMDQRKVNGAVCAMDLTELTHEITTFFPR